MESTLGKYLLTRLPKVRRLKDTADSVLAGLMDVFGLSLDEAKDVIQSLRRRAFIWQLDPGHEYYADVLRDADLETHALDRGTRRLKDETKTHLRERLQRMPHTRQYMGSAMGMKYLIEDVLGHTLAGLVVYCDDPQGRIQLNAAEQSQYTEENVSHIYSAADQPNPQYDPFRQNRIYSEADLDYRFQFWVSINPTGSPNSEEKARIVELINQEIPAHTVARVHFVGI